MGFLHKLWDDTLAGPAPESGLGKLRKYDSFSAVRSPPSVAVDEITVSRSITILRTNSAGLHGGDSGSGPSSPTVPRTPTTPLTPTTPRGDFRRLSRRKLTPEPLERPDANSTVYDWLVINALDR
ncbi:hypothetical protein NMG60_11004020 [Bertholletia excelsa]